MDFIEVIDSALPAGFCRELVEVFERHPAVKAGITGAGLDLEKKRSRDLTFDSHSELHDYLLRLQPVTLANLASYCRRYPFALIGGLSPTLVDPETRAPVTVDVSAFGKLSDRQRLTLIKTIFRSGTVNLQKYERGSGGYPHWHSEIFPDDARCESLHRALFYMYYLNDVAEGGETEFYFQRRRIRPRCGTMLIAPAGFTHAHRGNVPQSGDKYILTSWILFRRAEQLFAERKAPIAPHP